MKRRLSAICASFLTILVAGSFNLNSVQAADNSKPVASSASSKRDNSSGFADKYAVVIGIDSHAEPALNSAIEIDDGAGRVRDALLTRNFAPDHVFFLGDRDATKQAIMSSVGSSFLGKLCGKDDLAFVFVAMQCFPAIDGKTYLLPYDVRLANFYASAIDADDLLEEIKKNVKAKEVVIVFDTCFTGAPEMMAGCKTKFGQYNISIEKTPVPTNYTLIASSKSSQPTWGNYFADNVAKTIGAEAPTTSLSELFSKVRAETINDTTKDCAGCKLQSPIIASKSKPTSIALGIKPSQPRVGVPSEVQNYLKSQEVYSKCREVVDDFKGLLRAQKKAVGSTPEPAPVGAPSPGNGKEASGTTDGAGSTGSTSGAAAAPRSMDARELTGKLDDAIGSMKNYLQENPGFAAGHYILARLYECKNEYVDARNEFREAVKLEPSNSMYHTWLARALDRFGSDPFVSWKAAYDADHRNLGALDSLASKAVEDGDIDKAIALIGDGLKIYPGDAGLHVRMSFVQKRKGNMKSAIDHAQEAVFLDSNNFDALVNLGILLMANKDEKGAHAAFRQALDLGTVDVDDYFFLSGALEKTSDPGGAIEALERFVNAPENANDVRVDVAKKRLVRLKTPRTEQ